MPISMYNSIGKKGAGRSGGKIKVEIAVVKGKKKFDKRESMKKRDTERENRREFKDR